MTTVGTWVRLKRHHREVYSGVSKAFTRDSDDLPAEEISSVRPPVTPGAKICLTRQGAERLRQALSALQDKKRALSQRPAPRADAELRQLEFSIQKLKATLDSATIADPPLDQEKAGFGAFVHVRTSNGETETYQIVGVEEAEPAEGRISSLSPLGRVLMNRRAGEKVQFNSPAGDQEIGILRVWY